MKENNLETAKGFLEYMNGLGVELHIDELLVMYADWLGLATIEQRQEAFSKKVWAHHFKKPKHSPQLVRDFIDYWNSPVSKDQLRHETVDKFMIGGRLATFAKNQTNFEDSRRLAQYKRALGQVDPLF